MEEIMAKLYESRANNLIKPLTEKELGYVFGNKYIDKIIGDIDKKNMVHT
jgi:beta-mannanase